MELYRSAPHGEHRVLLVEDCVRAGQRIYEVMDHQGVRLGFTGEELASLAQWWMWESTRPGVELVARGVRSFKAPTVVVAKPSKPMDLRLPPVPFFGPEPTPCPECEGCTGTNDCPLCAGDGFLPDPAAAP